jgi:hypothetical protein
MLRLAAFLTLACTAPCAAQAIFTNRAHPLNEDSATPREVAIGASPFSPTEVAISWISRYSISLDGGASWPASNILWQPYNECQSFGNYYSTDPMVVASPATGSIHIGQLHLPLNIHSFAGFSVARKPLGSVALTDRTTIICSNLQSPLAADKGWLKLGTHSGSEVMYLGFGISGAGCPDSLRVYSMMSSPSAPAGTLWDRPRWPISDNLACGEIGNGVANVATVTAQGPVLLAAWNPGLDYDNTIRRPVARWSHNHGEPDGGQSSWHDPRIEFPRAYTPGGPADDLIFEVVLRSIVPGTFRLQNFPAAAKDPNDPNKVYIVFCGACESTGQDKLDLIVAQSIDGGRTFPSSSTLHLTQTLLQAPADSDQCFPAVTVDKFGGVNIAWYQVRPYAAPVDEPQVTVRVGWCRIGQFELPLPNAPRVRYLTPAWLPRMGDIGESIGDYIGICSSSCLVYAGYMSTHENTWPNIYCTRINLCPADSDGDGLVNTLDPPAFAGLYFSGSPDADITQDQQVNTLDAAAFLDAYTCGCGIP